MSKELLEQTIESLSSMINYADDEMLSRYDEDYKDFFEEIDKANAVLSELNKIVESEEQ